MLFAVRYTQELNPLGNQVASTAVAALPVLVLFYLLVGRRWLASWAGAAVVVVPTRGALRPAPDRVDGVRRDAAVQRDGGDRAVRDHPPVDRQPEQRRP